MLVVVVISLIVVGAGVVVVILVVGKGVVVEVLGATVAVFSKKPSLSGATVVNMGAKTRCGCTFGLGETLSASSFGGFSTPYA